MDGRASNGAVRQLGFRRRAWLPNAAAHLRAFEHTGETRLRREEPAGRGASRLQEHPSAAPLRYGAAPELPACRGRRAGRERRRLPGRPGAGALAARLGASGAPAGAAARPPGRRGDRGGPPGARPRRRPARGDPCLSGAAPSPPCGCGTRPKGARSHAPEARRLQRFARWPRRDLSSTCRRRLPPGRPSTPRPRRPPRPWSVRGAATGGPSGAGRGAGARRARAPRG